MNTEPYEQPASGQLTKKERRELRRQEARTGQARSARGRTAKRAITWLIVVAVLGGIGWLVWRAAQNVPAASNGAQELTIPVDADDNIKGSENAPITIVEYGDYQCPACAAYHPIVEQILEESDGQVRFVFRHFPLKSIHPNAETVARAVQAAGVQDKYWEMHDLVFERQSEWSAIPRGSARNKLLEYAAELGLDVERLDADMDSDAVKDKVQGDLDGGAAIITSTPTFFVNGAKLTDITSFEDFKQQILGSTPDEEEPITDSHDDSSGAMGEDL